MGSLSPHALLAVLVFSVVGLLTRWGALELLASSLGRTAVPEMLGLAFGAAAAAMVLAWDRKDARWGTWAVCASLAGLLVAVIVTVVPAATETGRMQAWAPVVSGAAALVWAGGWFLERRVGRRLPGVTGILLALAFAGGGLAIAKQATLTVTEGEAFRVWNVYHYYLGSKYFDKLGYTELYAATLAADDLVAPELPDGARTLQSVRVTRDMRTYRRVGRRQAVQGLDPDVDEATLRAMHHDLRGLLPFASDEGWGDIVSDLGYNPAPPWPVIGRPLTLALDTYGTDRWILTNLDVPLFALSLLAVVWAWGPRAAAGMVLVVTLVLFNKGRLLGGLLAYDWLASMLIGMALYRKGWSATGGAVLSWAAMTRVFPGFLVFPGLVVLGWGLVTRRSLAGPTLRFVTGFTAACALWFALSHTTGRGLATWPEWVEEIRVHSTIHPAAGNARLGLTRLQAHQPVEGDFWNGMPSTRNVEEARALHSRARPWQLLGLLLVVAVAVRRTPYERALWMLALVWVGVTTSRYYGSSWALLMVLGLPDEGDAGPEQSLPGVFLATALLLLPAVSFVGGHPHEVYFRINYYVAFVLLVAAVLFLIGDVRRRSLEAGDGPEPPLGPVGDAGER